MTKVEGTICFGYVSVTFQLCFALGTPLFGFGHLTKL